MEHVHLPAPPATAFTAEVLDHIDTAQRANQSLRSVIDLLQCQRPDSQPDPADLATLLYLLQQQLDTALTAILAVVRRDQSSSGPLKLVQAQQSEQAASRSTY